MDLNATISIGNWAISNKQLGDLDVFTLAQDDMATFAIRKS